MFCISIHFIKEWARHESLHPPPPPHTHTQTHFAYFVCIKKHKNSCAQSKRKMIRNTTLNVLLLRRTWYCLSNYMITLLSSVDENFVIRIDLSDHSRNRSTSWGRASIHFSDWGGAKLRKISQFWAGPARSARRKICENCVCLVVFLC